MKKDEKMSKKKAFTLTYALAALMVTAVVLIGLTPVLTRKLQTTATSTLIKSPKGWYEAYNAYEKGREYCATCKKIDEDCAPLFVALANCKDDKCRKEKQNAINNHKLNGTLDGCKWPEKIVYDGKIPEEGVGDPSYNPYVNPICKGQNCDPVPFERYCKSNGKCGFPKEQLVNPNEVITHQDRPRRCTNGKCQFMPIIGATNYAVYAVGAGGAGGSAVHSNPNLANDTAFKELKKSLQLKDDYIKYAYGKLPENFGSTTNNYDISINNFTGIPIIGATYNLDSTDSTRINASFLDRYEKAITNFYTVGDENQFFHTYPTEAVDLDKNETDQTDLTGKNLVGTGKLSLASIEQRKNIMKAEKLPETDKGQECAGGKDRKCRGKKYIGRYYLYTNRLGVLAKNQNPDYTEMPEWLSVDGTEKLHPTDDPYYKCEFTLEQLKQCDPNTIDYDKCVCKKTTTTTTLSTILGKYGYVVSTSCSGDAGKGESVEYHNTGTMCPWMRPTTCCTPHLAYTYKQGHTDFDQNKCNTQKEPEICYFSSDTGRCKKWEKDDEGKEHCVGHYVNCTYDDVYTNIVCERPDITTTYAKCSCGSTSYDPRCNNVQEWQTDCEGSPDANADETTPADQLTAIAQQINDITASGKQIQVVDNNGQEYDYSSEISGLGESLVSALKGGWVQSISWSSGGGSCSMGCNRIGDYVISATGGGGASGACGHVEKKISRSEPITMVSTECHASKLDDLGTTHSTKGQDRGQAESTQSCIFDSYGPNCAYATGAVGGTGASVPNVCVQGGHGVDGQPGKKGTVTCSLSSKKAVKKKYCTSFAVTNSESGEVVSGKTQNCISTTSASAIADCDTCLFCTYGCKYGVSTPECKERCANKESICNKCEAAKRNATVTCTTCTADDRKEPYKHAACAPCDSEPQIENEVKCESGKGSFSNTEVSNDKKIDDINGTTKEAGFYNWHYIWYMPYVTKHLMFGEAGKSGEVVATAIKLSGDAQERINDLIDSTPGLAGAKTDYKSGKTGENGGDTTFTPKRTKNKYTAHGGAGGRGSLKTDEYVLCHAADWYKYPCNQGPQSTHKIGKLNGEETFLGVQSVLPVAPDQNFLGLPTMSDELRRANPGLGSKGYGTESVSDFTCDERGVNKRDFISTSDKSTGGGKCDVNSNDKKPGKEKTKDTLLVAGGTGKGKLPDDINKKCNGNSRIKYILPNDAGYSAGTGAVIIMWE